MARCIVVVLIVVSASCPSLAIGQSTDSINASGPLREEGIADIKEMFVGCGAFVRPEYKDGNDINEPRPSANGVMAVEDMRCRQCWGKCKAESLRCGSQCVGDPDCFERCQERTVNCEVMCKRIFRCD